MVNLVDDRLAAFDYKMMTRALQLAKRAVYTTKPNPMVGCVLSRDNEIIAEGWHQYAGKAHAEILALDAAGERARGATAYVTLEPCAHVGQTGPCADALIAAGVARVVGAVRDPNSQVNGRGFQRLRDAGVIVQTGLMQQQAIQLNRGFFSRVETGRPWVRVKMAMSLDGRTALPCGDSKWISCDASRADVHHWRACSGAILTGSGTVLADNPALTVRLVDEEFLAPLRVVIDSRMRTVALARVRDGIAPTLYLHAPDAVVPSGFDAQHMTVSMHGKTMDLRAVLHLLGERNINLVQVEAGATLVGALFLAGLIDELLLYMAPMILGDHAKPLFAGLSVTTMAERLQLHLLDIRHVGTDIRMLLRSKQHADIPRTSAMQTRDDVFC